MPPAPPEVRIYRHPAASGLAFPCYQTSGAAGIDLPSAEVAVDLMPGSRVTVDTGLRVAIPEGWCGMIRSRSGLFVRDGVLALHGTIDSDYRGPLQVALYLAPGAGPRRIIFGERIAQLVLVPAPQAVITAVSWDEFSQLHTGRGDGGFGSTGSL